MTRSYPRKSGENYRRERRRKRSGRPMRWYGEHLLACVPRRNGDGCRPFRGVSKYSRLGTRAVEEVIASGTVLLNEDHLVYSTRYEDEHANDDFQVTVDDEGVAHTETRRLMETPPQGVVYA